MLRRAKGWIRPTNEQGAAEVAVSRAGSPTPSAATASDGQSIMDNEENRDLGAGDTTPSYIREWKDDYNEIITRDRTLDNHRIERLSILEEVGQASQLTHRSRADLDNDQAVSLVRQLREEARAAEHVADTRGEELEAVEQAIEDTEARLLIVVRRIQGRVIENKDMLLLMGYDNFVRSNDRTLGWGERKLADLLNEVFATGREIEGESMPSPAHKLPIRPGSNVSPARSLIAEPDHESSSSNSLSNDHFIVQDDSADHIDRGATHALTKSVLEAGHGTRRRAQKNIKAPVDPKQSGLSMQVSQQHTSDQEPGANTEMLGSIAVAHGTSAQHRAQGNRPAMVKVPTKSTRHKRGFEVFNNDNIIESASNDLGPSAKTTGAKKGPGKSGQK